jgi:hypothetical protein
MEEESQNKRKALINQLSNAFLNRKKAKNITKENEDIVLENNKSIYLKKKNDDKKSKKSELNNENISNNTNYTDKSNSNNLNPENKTDNEMSEFFLTENDLKKWEVNFY